MSIESDDGMHTPTCDYCGDELPAEFDFHDAVQAKKDAGWRSVKDDDEWSDYCPDCYAERKGAAADFKDILPGGSR